VKASWYGPGLTGQKTTSGEVYNPRALTAASKTLPIGSVVKVTNPENGKSVNVRINENILIALPDWLRRLASETH